MRDSDRMNHSSGPIRILHVVERMNRGGIEIWMMHILRGIDKEKFHIDFLVHTEEPGEFDAEILALGSSIVRVPAVKNPLLYAWQFGQMVRANAPYDVIHSHVHHFSGFILWLALLNGIPVRIAQSNSDTRFVDKKASYGRKIYLRTMKILIDRCATIGLAVSNNAAQALQQSAASTLPWQAIHCGISLASFSQLPDTGNLRPALGLPEDAMLVGHVGNFSLPKNHAFLIQVAYECIQLNPNCHFLLIGSGDLLNTIQQQVEKIGIEKNVHFLGTRKDVPLLLNLMDVFLFPSIFEGLAVAVVEAQAAGLPIVISDSITLEHDVVPGLLRWMSLSQSPALWAEACLQAYQATKPMSQQQASQLVSQTSFNILNNVQALQDLYAKAGTKKGKRNGS